MIAVNYGNWLYFTLIALMAGLMVLLLWLSKKKGPKWTDRFVFFMLWTNFALHFLKQLNPYYMAEFPFSLTRSSPENLCAVLVIAAVFQRPRRREHAFDGPEYDDDGPF